jgi:DNA end-binding protein Ku
MSRPVWSGYIRLSLVSVPVKAFSAEEPEERDLSFHQLHKKCKSRIRYKKTCPLHGEVTQSEIISAYEYAKGKYVELDDEDLERGKKTRDRGLAIENFIAPSVIDPLMFDGKSYYLLPDGDSGEGPYALLRQAMQDEDRWALAHAVLWRKNRLILLRPVDKVLTMSLLRFAEQTRRPAEFADELPKVKTNAAELRLAKRLIADSTIDEVDWSDYTDDFRERVEAIIDRKIKGEDTIDLGEDEEAAPTVNLMDALKKSLGEGKRSGSAKTSAGKAHAKLVTIRMPHAASRKRKPAAKTKAKRATTKRRKVS